MTGQVWSTTGHASGQYYAEVIFGADTPDGAVGLYDETADSGVMLNADGSIEVTVSGVVIETHPDVFAALAGGDVVGIKADFDSGEVWFRVNGSGWNNLDFDIGLPEIPWEGGNEYYLPFPNAVASGWSDPAFFPIGIWLSPPEGNHPANLKAAGVNFYMTVEHNVPELSNVAAQDLCFMNQMNEWTPAEITAEVGSSQLPVAWFAADEPDMNTTLGDEYDRLAHVVDNAALARSYGDGRFVAVNIGNGVNRTFWAPNTVDDMVRECDIACVDQYCYTAPIVRVNVETSPYWPGGSSQCAAAYGWLADQMRSFHDPDHLKPVMVAIETGEPLILEPEATTITAEQIRAAIWSALIHEARGIMFFQHNSDGVQPFYSLSDDLSVIRDDVTLIADQIRELAPVLNTQSYSWDSGASGIDTMLKANPEFVHIFAGVGLGGTPGTKTFALPLSVTGTLVTVVGEDRTLPVTASQFTDDFAAEYSVHIYRIAV